jgi:ABC-type Mn2+/Zn2+ transport system permease subunit
VLDRIRCIEGINPKSEEIFAPYYYAFYQEFLYQTFATGSARTSRIRSSFLDRILAFLTSVSVVIGRK